MLILDFSHRILVSRAQILPLYVVCSAFQRIWNHVAPISQGPAGGRWHGWRCLQEVHGDPFWSHLVTPLRFLPIFSCYFMTPSSLVHPSSACISGAAVFKSLPQS